MRGMYVVLIFLDGCSPKSISSSSPLSHFTSRDVPMPPFSARGTSGGRLRPEPSHALQLIFVLPLVTGLGTFPVPLQPVHKSRAPYAIATARLMVLSTS